MAKYLGIPLTISNGNRIPLTAQPELTLNGNFADGSDWTVSGTSELPPTSAAGTARIYTTSAYTGIYQNTPTYGVGKSFEVTITVSNYVSGEIVVLFDGGTSVKVPQKNGTFKLKLINDGGTNTFFVSRLGGGTTDVTISYVSIKEIAATETPTYGSPELVENGEFNEGNVDWIFLGANPPSINNTTDTLDFTNSPTTAVAKTSDAILEKGKRYIATIDIESITSGALALVYSAGTYSPNFTSAGVYNYDFVQDGSLNLASIECYSRNASTTAVVNSIKAKEVPYVIGTREFVTNGDFSDGTNGWNATTEAELSISSGRLRVTSKTANYAYGYQYIPVEAGKAYRFTGDVHYVSGAVGWLIVDGFDENNAYHEYGKVSVNSSTTTNSLDITFVAKTNVFTVKGQVYNNPSGLAVEIDNVSVKELEYNYLQVADGGFTKSVKEGDVVFNTSTSTEGVVKQVIDNNVLLMSNDNFSTAGEFFNVFAANGDTRGNQLIKTDNYIMSQYDENTSNPQESSFWFAGGKNSDKVALTQLNPATNTFFVAGVIEEYLERLNSQSATDSRLDIPLDAFRDYQYNEILTTTAITLS